MIIHQSQKTIIILELTEIPSHGMMTPTLLGIHKTIIANEKEGRCLNPFYSIECFSSVAQ